MEPHFIIGHNKNTYTVRLDRAPRPVTDAHLRFVRHVEVIEIDGQQHRIWRGSRRFRLTDDHVTTPERAALILVGELLPIGVSVRAGCGVVGCVSLGCLEVQDA